MVAWLILVVVVIFVVASLLSGFVFQRAARWVGVELDFSYATLVALAANIAQVVMQVVFIAVVVMTSPLPWDQALVAEKTLFQVTGGISGFAAWLAVTMILLDVDLGKAVLIAILNMILSFVMSIALAVTFFNILLIGGMAVLMGS